MPAGVIESGVYAGIPGAARSTLYILPTRYGLLFALTLFVMLMAAINYANGLAYALTFLLTAVALVTMLHTHRNLQRLLLAPGGCAPVFAGERALFHVVLHNPTDIVRLGIEVNHLGYTAAAVDVPPNASVTIALPAATHRRGRLIAPPVSMVTRFPLGLWRAWSRRTPLAHACIVYPRPAPPGAVIVSALDGTEPAAGDRQAGDDFHALREFRPGDAPRHVAWKAVARGQGWLIKEFTDGGRGILWLDWAMYPQHDPETRLSLLCRGILDAERAGQPYGLRLPGITRAPGLGGAHREHCLQLLALYPVE